MISGGQFDYLTSIRSCHEYGVTAVMPCCYLLHQIRLPPEDDLVEARADMEPRNFGKLSAAHKGDVVSTEGQKQQLQQRPWTACRVCKPSEGAYKCADVANSFIPTVRNMQI